MRELLLEGRVSWRSERSGRGRTLTLPPTRILGPRRLVVALGFAAVAAVVAALVAVTAGVFAAALGARWAAKRREQGLDDPIVAVVQRRVREAKEWIDGRRSREDNAPGRHL